MDEMFKASFQYTEISFTKLTDARDGRYVRCIVTDCYGGKLTTNPVTMKIG